jgi:hypothetical protein
MWICTTAFGWKKTKTKVWNTARTNYNLVRRLAMQGCTPSFVLWTNRPKSSPNLLFHASTVGVILLKCILFLSFHIFQAVIRKISMNKGFLNWNLPCSIICNLVSLIGQMIFKPD